MRFQRFSIGKPYIGAEWRFWLIQAAFFTKNTKSPQRNFRFQKQNSGICFISSGNVLLTGTNLYKPFFSSSEISKMSKKLFFVSQNLDFAWYFMVFLVRTSYTAADTLTPGYPINHTRSMFFWSKKNTVLVL